MSHTLPEGSLNAGLLPSRTRLTAFGSRSSDAHGNENGATEGESRPTRWAAAETLTQAVRLRTESVLLPAAQIAARGRRKGPWRSGRDPRSIAAAKGTKAYPEVLSGRRGFAVL